MVISFNKFILFSFKIALPNVYAPLPNLEDVFYVYFFFFFKSSNFELIYIFVYKGDNSSKTVLVYHMFVWQEVTSHKAYELFFSVHHELVLLGKKWNTILTMRIILNNFSHNIARKVIQDNSLHKK